MITIIIIFAFIVVLMILLGVIFFLGKGPSLIAGFNTLSKEEKEKYDTVALGIFMGKMMFALSFSVVLWLISQIYDMNWLFYFGLVLFIGLFVFFARNRFKKDVVQQSGQIVKELLSLNKNITN
ncbi:DUF3784 domain-containing protein [Virgibacillus halophilus]|uniref:DUF3784 domain-containing protein n=1 Tax=Tigheibacillus halophilus TaxID=361280 RepID=A0ABU5C5Z2_9BACI|nr:DUF3784 domain-containing protein [Virgibacillus halophilus]